MRIYRAWIKPLRTSRNAAGIFCSYLGLVRLCLGVALPVLQDLGDVDALEQVLEERPEPVGTAVGRGT